jgi:hypothetical protein
MIKQIGLGLAVAAFILAVAVGLNYAEGAGLMEAEWKRRVMQVVFGLTLAVYANTIPKQIGPARGSPQAQSRNLTALRVGGWCFTLSGLAYAGLWAFAPVGVADVGSEAVLLAGFLIALGYSAWCVTSCRLAPRS